MLENNELRKFKEFIEECALDHIDSVSQIFVGTQDYKKINNPKSELFTPLGEALPEESKMLLFDYEDKESELISLREDFFYRNGSRDAVMLLKTFVLDLF